MARRKLPPIHPGEILLEEFLGPLGISQYRLAKDITVPPRRINEIVHGKRALTADTALRLARYFGMTEEFWIVSVSTLRDPRCRHERVGGEAGTPRRRKARPPQHDPANCVPAGLDAGDGSTSPEPDSSRTSSSPDPSLRV